MSASTSIRSVAARTGHSRGTIDAAIAEAVATAMRLAAQFPKSRTILVDARVADEAGGSEAQELAVMAGSLVAYLRAFEAAGVAPERAFAQITISVAPADADLFLTVAKLRAARRIVGRIAEASAAPAAAASLRLAVTTSARTTTRRDPWTNMLRTTAAGGRRGVLVARTPSPYCRSPGRSASRSLSALRIARNTQPQRRRNPLARPCLLSIRPAAHGTSRNSPISWRRRRGACSARWRRTAASPSS